MYRNKVINGQSGWMGSPEKLDNCSLGLHFYTQLRDLCCEVIQLVVLFVHNYVVKYGIDANQYYNLIVYISGNCGSIEDSVLSSSR